MSAKDDFPPHKRSFNIRPYTADEERVCAYLQGLTGGQIGCGDDPVGFLIASHAAIRTERDRFRYALELIREAGGIHGGAWCRIQANGALENLDFDQWPDTGKPPADEAATGEGAMRRAHDPPG